MSQLDKAFKAFKSSPAPENAWALQVAMVEYQQEMQVQLGKAIASTDKPKPKNDWKPAELKTRKGGKWDAKLKEILELFAAFDWEVIPYKSNQYVESWKVTDVNLDQAVLYLTTNGFSMGGKKPDEALKGAFEGYEEQDRFDDFLVSNGIEIEE